MHRCGRETRRSCTWSMRRRSSSTA
jgi:hypothetical protein